jgi:hypothetical protein
MAERDRALRYVVRISQCDRSSDAVGLQNEADLTRKTMIPRHQQHRIIAFGDGAKHAVMQQARCAANSSLTLRPSARC